jgi:uncharacterized protein YuzE
MKFHYYAETDSLYIDLADRPGAESREVAPGVVLDFDAAGRLVGVDIDQASQVVDLSRLEAVQWPLQTLLVGNGGK